MGAGGSGHTGPEAPGNRADVPVANPLAADTELCEASTVATSRNPSLSALALWASTLTSVRPVSPTSGGLEESEGPVSSSIIVPRARELGLDRVHEWTSI